MSAELYACLHAKEFPAQALLRLRPEVRNQSCVVLEGDAPAEFVCSLNTKARAVGAARGMTRVEIETLPAMVALLRSDTQEIATRDVLQECAGSFTPRVENQSSGTSFTCVLDIAGTEKLFGAPEALANALFKRVRSLGITACVAVSSNFHAAVCMARGMSVVPPVRVVTRGREAEGLFSLPLSVLDVDEQHADTLAQWGIHTLGMLGQLPEIELISRLGQEGKRIRQLARGECPHLFQPIEPPFILKEHKELDSPIELLSFLLFDVNLMLEQLIIRAQSRMLALSSLTVCMSLESGGLHIRTVSPALPTVDRVLWLKLLQLDLEVHPPFAPIVALTLTAVPGSTRKEQLGLFSPQLPEPSRLDVMLAKLEKLVGEDCVGRAVLTDKHGDEAFRMERFALPKADPVEVRPTAIRTAMRVLRPPEEIRLTLREKTPQRFYFRAQRYIVRTAYGPWRGSGNWWNESIWGAEQWDIIATGDDGVPLFCCIARDAIQKVWRLVGLYD